MPENAKLDSRPVLEIQEDSVPLWISERDIRNHVGYAHISDCLKDALEAGLDPAHDLPRTAQNLDHGQLLLMPSQYAEFAGVKIASVSPDYPGRNHPRIQAVYVLMDSTTLTPVALIEGAALTLLRTAAVSLTAARFLAPSRVDHLAVFGSGPQASAHIDALRTVIHPSRISIVGRNSEKAQALADSITWADARVADRRCVSDAQLVMCATSSVKPVFHGSQVPDDCLVIAVGSHEPDKREVDSDLMSRAQIVVEDEVTAMRESGDLVIPLNEGVVSKHSLISLRALVAERAPIDFERPRVFTSTGMSWQDVVTCAAIMRQMGLHQP